MKPPYSRELIARRNSNDHPTEVYVAVGWPTNWLERHVETSPHARGAAIIATPEQRVYDFRTLTGLSVIVWIERGEDESRAHEIATSIQRVDPLRLIVLNAMTGAQSWFRLSREFKVAA
jgi:hypothetical protein